jgi:hypothetical protein
MEIAEDDVMTSTKLFLSDTCGILQDIFSSILGIASKSVMFARHVRLQVEKINERTVQ